MKKLNYILVGLLTTGFVNSQSFQTQVAPSATSFVQGSSTVMDFDIQVTPTGGFAASVYFEILLPPILQDALSLTTFTVNTPYSGAKVKLKYSDAMPPGTHKFVVKSYNGPVTNFDTVAITVQPSSCPTWFVYNNLNSGVPMNPICSHVDRSGKFWLGSQFPVGALACFDQNQWQVWSTTGFNQYSQYGALLSTGADKVLDWGIHGISGNGDTVYAISARNIYMVVQQSLTVLTPPMLTEDLVKVQCDHNGNLWVNTRSDLYRYSSSGWSAVQFAGAPFDPKVDEIKYFEVDHAGNIWFCARFSSVHRFDGNFWTSFNIGAVHDMKCSASGLLHVLSNSGLKTFSSGAFISYPVAANESFGQTNKLSFAGDIPLIGGPQGVLILNGPGTSYLTYNSSNSPVKSSVNGKRAYTAAVSPQGSMIVPNEGNGLVYKCNAGWYVGVGDPKGPVIQRAYPNPATDVLNIDGLIPDLEKNYLKVTDVLGRVFEVPFTSNAERTELTVTALECGVYVLTVQLQDGSTGTLKFIKN